MIFLAVTMGFFAENIREHIVNKERESQYMRSFVEDLSNDLIELPILIKSIQRQQLDAADSLPILLKNINLNNPANKVYFYFRGIIRQQPITAFITDRSIVQIRNAGEMRLISNKQIADSLIDYYKQIDFIGVLQGFLGNFKGELGKIYLPLLDSYGFDKVSDSLDKLVIPREPIYLRSTDPIALNNSLLYVSHIRGLSKAIEIRVIVLKNKAANIRKLITDKY